MGFYQFAQWLVENGGMWTWLLIAMIITAMTSAVVAIANAFRK